MKWSWRIGTIAGIGVYLHGTFLILLAWILLVHFLNGDDWQDTIGGLLFVACLFGIIVLHELGHALTARRYGIGTRDITLLPIGGVARLEKMPDDPKEELLVALAGPAVNVVLAVLLVGVIALLVGFSSLGNSMETSFDQLSFVRGSSDRVSAISDLPLVGAHFLAKLVVVNVVLAVFNLLPAFPMDGGRVLRALLAMRMDYVKATQIAASIGQGMAFLFGFIGLMSNPFLVFIALFVWMGAASEASMAQVRSALGGIPVRGAMITQFQTISPDDSLQDVAAHVLAGYQQDFPVMEHGLLVGMLTKSDLLRALAERGQSEPVRAAMRREFEKAEPSELLESVLERIERCECHSLPVVSRGDVVGVIDMDNIGEFIMLRSALGGK